MKTFPVFPNNEVVVLRTVAGEMIIGRYTENGDQPYLSKARTLIMQQGPNGQVAVSVAPMGMPIFSEDDAKIFHLPDAGVIMQAKVADPQMRDAYNRAVSGIFTGNVGGPGMPPMNGLR